MEDLENAMPFELAWPSASSSAADLADVGIPMSAVRRIVLQKSKIEQP
jgi:antitoxin component of RelBE/YafQ-DinJ toxin-antitoxin module